MAVMLDREKFDKLLTKYPTLEVLLQAGVLSRRMVRDMLDIDRWLMEDLHRDLLLCGGALGCSSSTFKGTPEAIKYIKERARANK